MSDRTDLAAAPPMSGVELSRVSPRGEELARLIYAWLLSSRSAHTRGAYYREATAWFRWCAAHGVDPAAATRGHVDAYARELEEGHGAASATIARALSAISSLYTYGVEEGMLEHNPAARARRPRVNRDTSATVGLSAEQARALLVAARAPGESRRTVALIHVLLATGIRVGELLALDVRDVGHDGGHRTLTVTRKGGQRQQVAVPPAAAAALDAYTGGRTDGALLTTRTGRRLDEAAVFRLVRRLGAAAGLPQAGRLSPHSLRHTCATLALDAGASLRDVQDLLGHADPRTTRRYDRARQNLDRSPAYLVGGVLAD